MAGSVASMPDRAVPCESASGQTVILTSKTAMPLSIKQLTRSALDPAAFAAIVAKGVHSPKATYRPYVRTMVLVDTPGPTSADLKRFTYHHRRRPMLPFEAEAALGDRHP